MNAQAAYRFIYARVTRGLDEPGRLKIDALLDLPGAKAALQAHYQRSYELLGEMA
jgi:hypothetical protein